MRVTFICNGNAYRSRMAEAYLVSLDTGIEVVSSGVLADVHRSENVPKVTDYTNKFLGRHGLPAVEHQPMQLTQAILDASGVLVALSPDVLRNIQASFIVPDDMRVWDIADFSDQDERDIESHSAYILDRIKQGVDELVTELL